MLVNLIIYFVIPLQYHDVNQSGTDAYDKK
jgi:hypothetical protein